MRSGIQRYQVRYMKTIENTSEYKAQLNGSISCTFDHPSLGEIPNGLSQERDAELIAEKLKRLV